MISVLAGTPGHVSQLMLALTSMPAVQDAGAGLLATIEEFMWYKLALVRPIPGDGPSTSGYFSGVCLSHPAEGSVLLAATVCAGVHVAQPERHCLCPACAAAITILFGALVEVSL